VIEERSYRRRLPAGIVDSAFASLATFVVGLAAVNLLDDVNRGVYAVYFTAFMAGTVLPRQLIFTPAEVKAVSFPTSERLSVLRQSIRLGLGPAAVGSLGAIVAWAVTLSYASEDVSLTLLVTSAAAIVLSPIQDHVRKMLHIAALSWRAAFVSVVQFVVVAVGAVVLLVLDVPIAWIPFGALTVANAVSLTFAWVVSVYSIDARAPEQLRFRPLAAKGVWLVLHAAAPSFTGFAVAAIIAALASPEALGYAESARVVAQPILVLAAGLTAVLAPRSMRAGMDLDLVTARRTSNRYLALMGLAGVGYLIVAGWDWALNPMALLVPSAYVLSGLVAVTIIGNIATSAVFLQINELLGSGDERRLAFIAWLESPVSILGALTAGVTGAFARPIGIIASSMFRFVVQERTLTRVYGRTPEAPATGSAPDPSPSAERE
jgi:O-antigen/teichoic acid export membrane protein